LPDIAVVFVLTKKYMLPEELDDTGLENKLYPFPDWIDLKINIVNFAGLKI
jgi:hypothetical protein